MPRSRGHNGAGAAVERGMSPRRARSSVALLGTAVAVFLLLGGAVAHAAARRSGNLSTRVEGTVTGGQGSFAGGSLVVSSFELRDRKLVAVGTLDGTVRGADGKPHEMADRAVVLELDRAALAATCDQAKVRLLPVEVEDAGVRVRLQPVELEIAATNAPGPKLHDALCELSRLLATSTGDVAIEKQLGLVLDALE